MATPAARIAPPVPSKTDNAKGRSRPPLAPPDRVLAVERDADGAPVVLSRYALHHRADGWQRLAWEEIGQVRSHGDRLDVTPFTGGAAWHLRLPDRTRLPDLVRERVAATTLVGIRIGLPDGRSALVAARRRPATGEPLFVVLLPEGADAADPDVTDRIDRAIHTLRVQF